MQWHTFSYNRSVDEFARLGLVKAFCLPLLTYCIGALDLLATCIRELAVCWNDLFRKSFGYKRCESVKLLEFYCSELPYKHIRDLQKWKFLSNMSVVPTRLVTLYQFKRHTLDSLSRKYGLNNCTAGINTLLLTVLLLLCSCDM